jgi:ribosomal protein S18 acetylase RimI-like enzyme
MLTASEPWITLGYRATDWKALFDAIDTGDRREAFVIGLPAAVLGAAIVRRQFLAGDYLEMLVVAPEARRLQLGRSLLAFLEARVFSRANNFFLCVSDFNEGARAFYRRLGYQEVGPLPDLLVAGRAEILMRKTKGSNSIPNLAS